MSFLSALTTAQHDGLVASGIVLLAAIVGLALRRVVFSIMEKIAARRSGGVLSSMLRRARGPSELAFPLIAVELAVDAVKLPVWLKPPLERTLGLCIIATIAWGIIALIELATELAKRRYQLDSDDNLHARQAETRLDILNRTATTLVLIVAVGIMLMTFPPIRAIGTTLLASAGLVGIAVGFAARPFFENLVAGLQIALTQPIRIDDVVVVGAETGRIEKIEATFVVVRLIDLRRLIVPLTYFLDNPFQNWTFNGSNLTGNVVLPVAYTVPVESIREELEKILAQTQLWDHRVATVSVTDAKETYAEVRVSLSASDSSRLFELQCLVREKLLAFLHLPADVAGPAAAPAEPARAGIT
jgi:small-conductance mechanosensitive channel